MLSKPINGGNAKLWFIEVQFEVESKLYSFSSVSSIKVSLSLLLLSLSLLFIKLYPLFSKVKSEFFVPPCGMLIFGFSSSILI